MKKLTRGRSSTLKRPAVNRYPESEIKRLLGEAPKSKVAIYARVSSADQREDLERQKQRLVEYAKSKGYKLLSSVSFINLN